MTDLSLNDLVEAALLGTERSRLPQLTSDSPLHSLMFQREQGATERANGPKSEHSQRAFRLLSVAGAIGLYEQVGQLPQRLLDVVVPKNEFRFSHDDSFSTQRELGAQDHEEHERQNQYDDETWPSHSAKSSYYLSAMLDNRYQNLLREYLMALAQMNRQVRAEHLPNLLDRGVKTASLRPLILAVIGEVGRWLAAQNPAWHYATPNALNWDVLTTQWPQGSTSTRQALLQQTRRLNPRLGRQLLESTWKSEPPNNRAWFVRTLATGLSMEDEPFLEAALDDRHHTTRRHAAQILASLPESRLSRRMTKNCANLFSWTPDQDPPLTVSFPEEISAQMVRDGVLIRKGKDTSRIRSNQIVDMVGTIPLQHWTALWQTSPARIIAAAQKSRWPRTLIRAFATAAERQRNTEWARALLQGDKYSDSTLKLVELLTEDELRNAVEETMMKERGKEELPVDASPSAHLLSKNTPLVKLLRRWSKPWPEEVATIWLRRFVQHLALYHQLDLEERPKTPDSIVRTQTKQFARLCPISLTNETIYSLRPLVADDSPWRLTIHEMIAILKFRRGMLASIDEESGN